MKRSSCVCVFSISSVECSSATTTAACRRSAGHSAAAIVSWRCATSTSVCTRESRSTFCRLLSAFEVLFSTDGTLSCNTEGTPQAISHRQTRRGVREREQLGAVQHTQRLVRLSEDDTDDVLRRSVILNSFCAFTNTL